MLFIKSTSRLIIFICIFLSARMVGMDLVNSEEQFSAEKTNDNKCYNLIVLFDPKHSEKRNSKKFPIVGEFVTALIDKAAPIITTINIVDIVCHLMCARSERHNENATLCNA